MISHFAWRLPWSLYRIGERIDRRVFLFVAFVKADAGKLYASLPVYLYGEQYAATLQERGRIGGVPYCGNASQEQGKVSFRPTLCTVKQGIFVIRLNILILSSLKRSAPLVLKPDAADLGCGGEQDKNTVGAKSVISVM